MLHLEINKTVMKNSYPFHYEVRFKFLAFDSKNNVRNESFTKIIKDSSPLINRNNAFQIFEEYLAFLEQQKRLKKNKQGNYLITQPSFITEVLKTNQILVDDIDDIHRAKVKKWMEDYEQFKEDISIFLVITDEKVALNILDAYVDFNNKVQTEFEIHTVASYEIEEQEIIDNLDLFELPLFAHYGIDVSGLVETVYHYGLDYEESKEDVEEGAKRIILRTPHFWSSLEMYNKFMLSHSNSQRTEVEESDSIDYLKIIEKGEGHQIEFKPCLLYNFKTGRAGISVKYIVAKAICGFLNSNGGVLFIGVKDNKEVQGLDYDFSLFSKSDASDKILLEFDSLLVYFFGISIKPLINASIKKINDKDVMVVLVQESSKPVFLKNKRSGLLEKEFYIRMSASTHQVTDIEEIVEYVFNKKWRNPNGNHD